MLWSQDTSVGIVSDRLQAGQLALNSWQGQDFSLLHRVLISSWAHSPMDTGGSFPVVKRPGREAGHSPPSSAEVKNGGVIPPLPNVFMA
jgi:hypothetical protein